MVEYHGGQILLATDYFHHLVDSENLVKNGHLNTTIILGATLMLIACNLFVLLKIVRKQHLNDDETEYLGSGGGGGGGWGGDLLLGEKKLIMRRHTPPFNLWFFYVNSLTLATVIALALYKHVEYQILANSVAHLEALYTELHQAHMG
jgi:hypothetical protein